ncbi:hypothetical protein LTR10_003968 [Elasticomyces elasticus]|uniref:VOC domain-containing protein n=1 Tax=Elasticomyces elasticus TaxID=574655 RepID=A0AAN7WI02_9PEZI|nr:hypothetical protein LTR10_003968 [Elasticomyces elasticus]KAK4977844.1 hypothetical protein LTR42_002219 [Elasticomyces elasticus]KAK5706456.1 hypothetical protein LTR97_001444 [Elasticomyces elasticus]
MPPTQDQGDRIQLVKTAYVVYYHSNLDEARTFLLDFGLTVADEQPGRTIYFKGYGTEPYVYVCHQSDTGRSFFGGAAYIVDSERELEKASRLPSSNGKIQHLHGPGGGWGVTLTDPAGHKVHLIHGWQEEAAESKDLQKLVVNFEDDKPRKGKFVRLETGPAPVYRWGHYGVTYPSGTYEQMYDWYTTTLTLAPSDVVLRGEKPITCFFHVDRGEVYTDHHCFFFKMTKPNDAPGVAHAAFEVHDFDVQQLGHQHLVSKGYELCWGVGRHVLGSQVFDYWFDPSKFILEHYADGDLVNSNTPVAKVQAGPQALSVWGPPVPEVF